MINIFRIFIIMKFIITEDQNENLKKYNFYKKGFFKYWDKLGPDASNNVMKFFNTGDFNYGKIKGDWGQITLSDVQDFLKEWLGGRDKAISIAEEFISSKTHKIDECGGYDFEFDVTEVKSVEGLSAHDLIIDIYVHDTRGTVELIMTDGEVHKLSDAIKNDEYGWEIMGEIQDCIWDYFYSKVTNKTGVRIEIDNVTYYSDVNPQNR